MQTVAQKAFTGKAVRNAPATSTRSARCTVVVRASAEESRRAVLGGFVAGVAALTASAANAIDIIDDRKARANGFDIIYEARDLDLPQNVRDGLTQYRTDIAGTKKRIAESEKRIDGVLDGFVNKKYWTEAREELRRQAGTLRFDIDTLAGTLPKDAKKEALALKQALVAEISDLDYAIRKKDQTKALKELADTKAALDAVIAKLV